ncbi:PIG-L family deacetylase [Aliarcobacter butzleri]|uniref:PIG-L family deacetylase n=2 Tax=Aliarcobacter butzleri TaxID=28197 RepID=A0AAW7PYM1_9BACT|nr:PIG-L deacetylase family protein [Aliarcobacter butzleri]KLE01000.1 GlcNAc-PI de-N-acetylase [Aliarcobacter butzleri L348]MCT7594812.1 PIG-L family deacetylase [Aliarcobacter butzleri]MCT7599387.1 PIG-L family deacetylase [Aliarcobacter butzleri]MCT7605119.1 PIG-L family deacetylase [Aliarcobacter butzleri]MCT7607376.1 PIG-L family deacetylase [Aliarcobacter butzleri]
MSKKILIVVAHPDDEVLGCFGTVARLIKEGYEAYTLILGEGKTSRDEKRVVENKKDEIEILNSEIKRANDTIGIKKTFIYNFADNRFDSVDLLDIVKVISKVKEEIKPDIIFTHYENDLNIDHTITYKAVLTATRPMKNECVKEIYSFEILSSTEWNYPISFSPDVYFDIEDFIDIKLEAMKKYYSELCEYPHPRSLEGIKLNAQYNGMRVGKKYVEAFKCIRIIK